VGVAVGRENHGFARVFEGGFGKCGAQRWLFCGEVVVDAW